MPPIPATQVASGPIASRFGVEGAAAYIGLSVSFLNKARLTGAGPTYLKLGSRIFYERTSLDSWMASCRRTSTSEAVPCSVQ